MATLTIELPDELFARLERMSGGDPEERSRIVVEALERYLDEHEARLRFRNVRRDPELPPSS